MDTIKVMICGKEYKLKTSESPNYVYSLARSLESRINELAESGASPYSAAIMVSLSILDDLNKANKRLDDIQNRTKDYVDETGKARIERDAALKEIDILNARIDQLENNLKLKKLKESIE